VCGDLVFTLDFSRSHFSKYLQAIDLLDEAGAIAHLNDASDHDDDDDDDNEENFPVVDEHTMAMVISEWASIPLGKLESTEMDRLVQLEEDMIKRVKGQGRAIQSVARAVRRARSGLRDPQRPIASFMFCGPTGTGELVQSSSFLQRYFMFLGF
jgi:ATP-dependent Clp protease ATP-binding subunit ClpC